MFLAPLRCGLQQFAEELARESYRLGAGLKDAPDFATLYSRYGHLLNRTQIARLQDHLARAVEPEERRRAEHLLSFLIHHVLVAELRQEADRLQRTEVEQMLRAGGRSLSYAQAQSLLPLEADRERRRELSRVLDETAAKVMVPLSAALWAGYHRVARELGYPSYLAMWDGLKGLHVRDLLPLCDEFLAETRDLAMDALAHDLDRYLGLSPDETELHDYQFLSRANHFDPYFPPGQMIPALFRTLEELGLEPGGQHNIHLDLVPRGGKSVRAFCAAIRCPEEVRIVVHPRGGADDYHSLFHEAGHAQHFGHVARGTAFEVARLGDLSISETYAFLLQHLLHDERWLARHLRLPPLRRQEYRRFAFRRTLLLIRRYCGKLRYEVQLHQAAELPAMATVYSRELTGATFLWYGPMYFLRDLDPGLYTAQYLRGWLAAAQLRSYLRRRFGPEWWRVAGAGEFLRSLWAQGSRLSLDPILHRAGYSGFTLRPLLEELMEGAQ